MNEELARCRAMTTEENLAEVKRVSFTPSVAALLERVEIVTEEKPAGKVKCGFCAGSGRSGVGMQQPCKNCNGTGEV